MESRQTRRAMRHLHRAQQLLAFGALDGPGASGQSGAGTSELYRGLPRRYVDVGPTYYRRTNKGQKSEDTEMIINTLRASKAMQKFISDAKDQYHATGHKWNLTTHQRRIICTSIQSRLEQNDAVLLKKIIANTDARRDYVSDYEMLEVCIGIENYIWNYEEKDEPEVELYDPQKNEGIGYDY